MVAGRWRIGAALLSGGLLALAFPPFEIAGLAWIGFIPLLLALIPKPGSTPMGYGTAFRLGYVGGAVFWLLSMAWMLKLLQTSPAPSALILVGWILLAAYCALYFGAFCCTVSWVVRKIGVAKLWQTSLVALLIPMLWVGWEMARTYWFTGFPWNLLGVSQFRNLALIQTAEWGGVAMVSALVMLANACLALTVYRYLPPRQRNYRPHLELFIALFVMAVCFRWGMATIRAEEPAEKMLKVAVVQPAIPQVKKWSQEQIDLIHATFRRLTDIVLQSGRERPDLVIWPETATPYCVTEEGESRELVLGLSRLGAPLLVGSMDVMNVGGELICYNGSFLFDTNGVLSGKYYKQHLVPFGEYVPLSSTIPWLANFAPMGWNCLPGHESTVFEAGVPSVPFSCLICFEDIMAGLSRSFVKAGARLLVTQTNDAWFDETAGPLQHLANGIFRCVENRVPGVRVGNSGISCLILPTGAVLEASDNDRNHAPREMAARWQVAVPSGDFCPTLYTRYGDWIFGFPCGLITAAIVFWAMVEQWQDRRNGQIQQQARDAANP